jgi:hypothetical protein
MKLSLTHISQINKNHPLQIKPWRGFNNLFMSKKLSKNTLQSLYNDACWWGYTTHKGKKYTDFQINQIAHENGFELEYPQVH